MYLNFSKSIFEVVSVTEARDRYGDRERETVGDREKERDTKKFTVGDVEGFSKSTWKSSIRMRHWIDMSPETGSPIGENIIEKALAETP